jgi:hypothetical protein
MWHCVSLSPEEFKISWFDFFFILKGKQKYLNPCGDPNIIKLMDVVIDQHSKTPSLISEYVNNDFKQLYELLKVSIFSFINYIPTTAMLD